MQCCVLFLFPTCAAIIIISAASASAQPATQTAPATPVIREELLSPEQVAEVVNLILKPGHAMPHTGELGDKPRRQVVSAIVDAIQNRIEFRRGALRTRAYAWLFYYRAADTEDGFDQLIRGLRDAAGRIDCVRALALAPADKHARVVQEVGARLLGARGGFKQEIIQTLGKLGPASIGCWIPIEQLFLDRRVRLNYRWAAVCAMLEIKPVDATLKHAAAGNLDPAGRRVLLWALARFGLETQFTFKTNRPDDLEFLRRYVIENMTSPERESRAAALEALPIVFGNVLFVNNQPEPRVAAALQRMTDRDPDPVLRERATDQLDRLKKMPVEEKAKLSQPNTG